MRPLLTGSPAARAATQQGTTGGAGRAGQRTLHFPSRTVFTARAPARRNGARRGQAGRSGWTRREPGGAGRGGRVLRADEAGASRRGRRSEAARAPACPSADPPALTSAGGGRGIPRPFRQPTRGKLTKPSAVEESQGLAGRQTTELSIL